jgi:hypothetical protein
MTSEPPAPVARRGLRLPHLLASPDVAEVAQSGLPSSLHAAVPLAIVAVWAVVVSRVRLSGITDLGLISVLPGSVIVLVFLLTASFCFSLTRRPLRSLVPLLHVIVLIVMLYGVTTFLEPEPRVSAVYKHVGVMTYIAQYGSVRTNIDAYFNWPGFFALGALITKAAGFHSALAFAAWGPLVFNLLFLAPLVAIFRWASDDPRVTWAGLWVFYSINWVAQDHIAPQAISFLLWLSMLVALLTWFTPRPAAFGAVLRLRDALRPFSLRQLRLLRDRSFAPGVLRETRPNRVLVLLLVLAMFAAIVTGHQLSPVPVFLTATGLVLIARLETRTLPVIMVVLLAAWISFMTTSYLAGNFNTVLGSLGHVSQNVGQGVGQRLAGTSDHKLIVDLRLVSTVLIWILALFGLVRRLSAGHADFAMAVVAGAPFLLPALQPYGGEIFLRVFLFASPAVAFAIASFAFPTGTAGRTWHTLLPAAIVGCVLLGLFQYTRYGNERLDNFTPGDTAIVHRFYSVAPRGATVYAGNDNLPWRYRDYASYDYHLITDLQAWRAAQPDAHQLAGELLGAIRAKGGGYVLVTRSTEIAASLLDGKPGTLERLVKVLAASPGVREISSISGDELFQIQRANSQRG